MKRYFRCDDPTQQCPYSRTREILIEGESECPNANPLCQSHRQPVPWFSAISQRHPWTVWGGVGVVAALALLFLLLPILGSDAWAKQHALLSTEVAELDAQLAQLEAAPPPPSSGPVAATDSLQLGNDAARLSTQIDEAVTSGAADEARLLLAQLDAIGGQVAAVMSAGDLPDSRAVDRSMAASRLVRGYETLEERAETVQAEVSMSAGSAGAEAFAVLIDGIRDAMSRARSLAVPVVVVGSDPQLVALQTQIQGDIDRARQAIDAIPQPVVLPFPATDAGLVVASSPGLDAALVVPLAQARWGESATLDQDTGQWFLPSADPEVAPGVLIRVVAEDPSALLIEDQADLVITDMPTSPTIRERFAAAFPGDSIDSRAFSEVIALDAVALLGHPDASDADIGVEGLAQTRWLSRAGDSPWMARLGLPAMSTEPVEDPFAGILGHPETRAVALFHQCAPNLRAKYLAYQPGPEVRALAPSPFSIGTEDYGLSFRVVATHSPRARPATRKFVEFMTSDPGQKRIAEAGFVDLRLRHREEAVDPVVLATLGEALGMSGITRASRYSTNLRFGLNASALDIKAQADIGRLARALAQDFPTGKVVILGFTDSTGASDYNHGLSVKRAEHIATTLMTFDIPATAAGLGQQLPVDSNDTETGRSRNRRAEVWVVQP
jgi:outer membrane protein OmpA-like peptidoglycan-associated protein